MPAPRIQSSKTGALDCTGEWLETSTFFPSVNIFPLQSSDEGWKCRSEVELFLAMCESLGSIQRSTNKNKHIKTQEYNQPQEKNPQLYLMINICIDLVSFQFLKTDLQTTLCVSPKIKKNYYGPLLGQVPIPQLFSFLHLSLEVTC